MTASTEEIGGALVVALARPAPPERSRPAFLSAEVLPGRGMMVLQVRAWFPGLDEVDLLAAPPLAEARRLLDGAAGDFPGNASYSVGGAILLPYANRIRGELAPDGKRIRAGILGRSYELPANAGGRRPGAQRFAMHGLILDARAGGLRRETTAGRDSAFALLDAGDFGGRWPSATEVAFETTLRSGSFTLGVTARNAGREPLPMGIGWHPYFVLPSGRREQARLHLPARRRLLVGNYDEVLPTGEVVPVAGTPYDFSAPGGRALGELFLDDCFVDLAPSGRGEAVAEIVDPAASYGLRVAAAAPPVAAFQVYAPERAEFVALEPQLNRSDPFGAEWGRDVDTGMAILEPGESVAYTVRLELFVP